MPLSLSEYTKGLGVPARQQFRPNIGTSQFVVPPMSAHNSLSDRMIGASQGIRKQSAQLQHESVKSFGRNTLRIAEYYSVKPISTLTRVFGKAFRAYGSLGLRKGPLITMGLAAFGLGAMKGLYESYEGPHVPTIEPGAYKPQGRGMKPNHLNTEGLTLALHRTRHR